MTHRKKRARVGAHVSVAGGLWRAFANAEAIGAEMIQIFGSSPQTWAVRMPDEETVRKFREEQERTGIAPIFLHAAYLVNIASPDPAILKNSKQSLVGHLCIAEAIGGQGLIFHTGSTKGEMRDKALEREAKTMRDILRGVAGKTELIMENTAGGGNKVGDLSDLKWLFETVDSPRVKVCFDTAHAFEAGIVDAYTPESVKQLLQELDRAVGIRNIVAIHANDSKTPSGSHHDRHENIGKGYIGIEGFRALAAEEEMQKKPWILEVPGFGDRGADKKNVDLLRSCFV